MGVQGVVLEDHGDVPVLGRHIVHQSVTYVEFAGRWTFQPGDHAQGGGLSAAGRPHQHHELLVADFQIKLGNRRNVLVKDFADIFKSYACHAYSFFPAAACHFCSRWCSMPSVILVLTADLPFFQSFRSQRTAVTVTLTAGVTANRTVSTSSSAA